MVSAVCLAALAARFLLVGGVPLDAMSAFLLLGLLVCGRQVAQWALLARTVASRGWNVSPWELARAWHEVESPAGGHVPWAEEWKALPAHNPDDPEVESLCDALAHASGIDYQHRRGRRPVVVHVASSAEFAGLLRDALAADGFTVYHGETGTSAAWGAPRNSQVVVPAAEAAEARVFLEEWLGTGDDEATAGESPAPGTG
jgi:hypothetical protein